ncbi:methyltransferase [Leifsonia sp. F6_8S_P_1B]|uniref:Methyltransferase n=1 Tax=Leifsonia williamsii TaxID=3035919 RepID=A0ABT8KHV3_9MICO|nr:methyltransferase [Leifsonia williamsii]MDN4615899.1 methyltransferase [Leifsonia williamsii]
MALLRITRPIVPWLNGRVNPSADRSALIAALRADLTAARFSVGALDALWGAEAAEALHRGQRVPAERAVARHVASDVATGGASALPTLARLFVLGVPVPVGEVEAALPSLGVAGAAALGLVREAEGVVAPAVDLRPYAFEDARGEAEWWIVSDLGELALGHALPEDHVLGVGGASLTLSGLMLQRRVETALDLGTGCGIQAMHARRHADRVVATDISPRALELAALNAELNGIDGIEFRLGSMFEPVAGERFDHIVSNPPFVITPRVEGVPAYEYRDGGMVGDAVVAAFVRDCGEHLTPGGVAQLLGNWEYRPTEDGLMRVRGWVDASPTALDAWVIERDTEDAVRYAETWIRDGGTRPGTPAFDRLLGAWLDDFEARDVSAVGFGYLLLRRAEGEPTLRRFERLHGSLGANEAGLGVHLDACLTAHDAQAALDDAALGMLRLTVAPDVTEERHLWPGADAPTAILLRQGGGFGRAVAADTGLAALVGACDGELSIAAIVGALAQLLDVDEGALSDDLLPAVRGLVGDGMLLLPTR